MTKEEYIKHQSEILGITPDQYERDMPYNYVVYNILENECNRLPNGDICVYGDYNEAIDECTFTPNRGDAVIREDRFVEYYLEDLC